MAEHAHCTTLLMGSENGFQRRGRLAVQFMCCPCLHMDSASILYKDFHGFTELEVKLVSLTKFQPSGTSSENTSLCLFPPGTGLCLE